MSNIGKLKERVIINQFVTTRNNYGEEILTPELVVDTWCEVVSTSASEKYKEFHPTERVSKIIKIRDRASLGTLKHKKMDAVLMGETYSVSNWFREYNEIVLLLIDIKNG